METATNDLVISINHLDIIHARCYEYITKVRKNEFTKKTLEDYIKKYSYINQSTCILPFMNVYIDIIKKILNTTESTLDLINSFPSEDIKKEFLKDRAPTLNLLFQNIFSQEIILSDEQKNLKEKQISQEKLQFAKLKIASYMINQQPKLKDDIKKTFTFLSNNIDILESEFLINIANLLLKKINGQNTTTIEDAIIIEDVIRDGKVEKSISFVINTNDNLQSVQFADRETCLQKINTKTTYPLIQQSDDKTKQEVENPSFTHSIEQNKTEVTTEKELVSI